MSSSKPPFVFSSKTPKAKSAYLFFSKEKRVEIVNQNPGMKPTEVLKEIGRLWKEAPEDEKEKYERLAKEDKPRIEGEKQSNSNNQPTFSITPQNFQKTNPFINKNRSNDNRSDSSYYSNSDSDSDSDDQSQPKKFSNISTTANKTPKAKSAYLFFSKEKRVEIVNQNPGMKPTEVLKEIGRLWKEASEDEKEKYERLAKEDKPRIEGEKQSNSNNQPTFSIKPKSQFINVQESSNQTEKERKRETQNDEKISVSKPKKIQKDDGFSQKVKNDRKEVNQKNKKREFTRKVAPENDDYGFFNEVSEIVNDVLEDEAPEEEIEKLCAALHPILINQVKIVVKNGYSQNNCSQCLNPMNNQFGNFLNPMNSQFGNFLNPQPFNFCMPPLNQQQPFGCFNNQFQFH